MKQKVFFLLSLLILTGIGCNTNPGYSAKTGEGMVVYNVSYPDSLKYGIKYTLFPKQIILVFKDEKATFIASGALGMIQLVNLLDHKNKKVTSLLIDNLRENYGCRLTDDEIRENENHPLYEYEFKQDTSTIAGLKCHKAVVRDVSNNRSFDIRYYDKIKFYYWNSPFKEFNYLLTEYSHTVNNLTMKLTAVKIDLDTPVDTSLFGVKGEYHWINQKQFYERLGQL